MTPFALKTAGYILSAISVVLLATVAWPTTSGEPLLAVALVAGAALSVLGMGVRWLSYWVDGRLGQPPAGKP